MLVEDRHFGVLEPSPRLELVEEEDPRPGEPLRISEGPQDKFVSRHLRRLEEGTGPHRLDVQTIRRHVGRSPPLKVLVIHLQVSHRRL